MDMPSKYHALDRVSVNQGMPPIHHTSTRLTRFMWLSGYVFIGICMTTAALVPFLYFFPFYTLSIAFPLIRLFGGNPLLVNMRRASGHSELVMPTAFFVGMGLPIVLGAITITLVRSRPGFRWISMTRWLQRKPRLLRCTLSHGELLFLTVLLGGNVTIFIFQWMKRYKPQMASLDHVLEVIAFNLASNGLFNLSFLALPATRHCFWMEWLNIPYTNAIKYHQWLGVVVMTCFSCHMLSFFTAYAHQGVLSRFLLCFDCNLATDGIGNWTIFFGILAFTCMALLAIMSLPYVRRHHYAWFYAAHHLFIPAAIFAVLHWGPILYWLYATIVLYLVNRFFSSASTKIPVQVETAVALPANISKLTLHTAAGYFPGESIWINAPAISTHQWHPFSIASSPLHTPGLMTIYIKRLGTWTTDLYEYINHCQASQIDPVIFMRCNSPATTIPSLTYSHLLFVAGGVGITPFMGQILHIMYIRQQQEIWLIWHVKSVKFLLQFQSWLHDLQSVALVTGIKLHLSLHITQESCDEIDPSNEPSNIVIPFPNSQTYPAPQAHSPPSQTLYICMLLAAYLSSGGLLLVVKYGNQIESIDPQLWPLQRLIEFLAVVFGCTMAYGVAYIFHLPQVVAPTSCHVDSHFHEEKNLDVSTFLNHFRVKYGRATWTNVFYEVNLLLPSTETTLGVSVCGPATLSRAVELEAPANAHIHIESFQL